MALAFLLGAVPTTTTVRSQGPAFEVVSVKPNRSGFAGGMEDLRQGGQYTATNETMRQLVRSAYQLETFRIIGGPAWLDVDRFDIQAKAPSAAPRSEMLSMLRALLTERFRLRVRQELRELPIYVLVVARDANRQTGGRLRPGSAETCVDRGDQPVRVPAGELPSCGLLRAGPGAMSLRGVPLAFLGSQLSSRVNRAIVDRTGLAGKFDVDLEWTPSEATRAAVAALTPGAEPQVVDPDRPGIFTALEEQLGLKLEPARGPVDVLIVESAEPPAAD